MKNNNWEKEFETFFIWSKPMEKPTAFTITDKIKLKSFISNLLAQERKEAFQEGAKIKKRCRNEDIEKIRQEERKEHIEMTKELVAKKNKDCQRYLETQRTQILEEFLKVVGEDEELGDEDDEDYGLFSNFDDARYYGQKEGKNQVKQGIRSNLKALKDK